jgi:WD40 repeat protein
LSASVDNSVRLWQIGCEDCLGIFSHNNYGNVLLRLYNVIVFLSSLFVSRSFNLNAILLFFFSIFAVTSVQFNPVDDDHFISGSIDGKVRIWSASQCQVVDWADARGIVTAVCYQPDGQV